MQLVFGKSRWEMWDDPLETFLRRAKMDGFAATEIALFGLREAPAEVASLHAQYGLRLIGQVLTQGATCRDHLDSLEEQFARGEFAPLKEWLGEKIHRHGQCYSAAELVEKVTGKSLSPAPLMAHLRAKLAPLYGLN